MNTISQVFKYTQIFKRKENYQKPNQFDVNQDAGITEDLNRAKNQEKIFPLSTYRVVQQNCVKKIVLQCKVLRSPTG